MFLEIVTPEAVILTSEVHSVTVPGINGEFQMLNNHAPIVSLLVNGNVKFKGGVVKIEDDFKDKFTKVDGEYVFAINSGTIEMKENKVIVLAD
ncbi:MAG: F0F1 ATP synthase subunit epsilon [Flavobacteriaceae bacterium]|nr:F0F1 ATP synthase subunit epsilon [Flavobacteriaceae bacterium]